MATDVENQRKRDIVGPKSSPGNARHVPVIPHPDVVPVDLGGRSATTIEDGQLTTHEASTQKALVGAFRADVRSGAGQAQETPLMVAFRQHLARQKAAKAAADRGAEDVETVALMKSAKKLGKHLRSGVAASQAVAKAHAHYRAKGGRSGLDVWARKINSL